MLSTRNDAYIIIKLETILTGANTFAFGSATNTPSLSIASNVGPGALWFNRKVRVHPRFEVKLKVTIPSFNCNRNVPLHGFTIILSKTPNYMNGGGSNLGYFNIFNSIVIEIDLEQNMNLGDSGPTSLSYKSCINTTCNANESANTVQRSIEV
jgi:hypothetical protein